MSYETVIFDVQDRVARITLNRPEAANSINSTLARELMQVAICCDEDPEIRAVILTGSGDKTFSAGGDLKAFISFGGELPSKLKELTVYLHAAISRFARMDAPLIAAVNGVAAGAGVSLAVSADIVFAAKSARLAMAYTGAGLAPDGGSTYYLPRLIGLRRTQELMLTNRVLNAREAMDWGLVNRVVPDADLIMEAQTQAVALAKGPTRALGSVKKLLNESFSETLETQMEFEARAIAQMANTDDAHEGIAAFVEKRQPDFTGS